MSPESHEGMPPPQSVRGARTAIRRNVWFVWLGLVTGLVLLVPLVAMQFTSGVNWTASDFVVMGGLLFGTGSLFVLLARRLAPRYWVGLGIILSLLFVAVWIELAVGVFTNLGS